MKMEFDGKVVLVTGSSRGLGREFALAFARLGADVGVNYVSSGDKAAEVVKEIEALGRKAVAVRTDVSKEEEVVTLFKSVTDALGAPDILVNNAAIYVDSTVAKMDKQTWDKVMGVGMDGVFLCTKHAIPAMKEKGWGRIVNVSSVVGQIGIFGTANYTAAKAGVIGFTKAAAKEVARKGITVNSIALGYFDAGMNLRLPEEIREATVKTIPMKRFGKASEAAAAVTFLCSDGAAYITGQVLNINGGYYM